MATVTIEGDRLIVDLSGWEAVFALKRRIDVPISSISSARAGTLTSKRPNGLRLPGTYVPAVITAGSYWWKGRGWSFWSVRHHESTIDIRLHETRYHRIVIEVADPYETEALITGAIRKAGSTE